MRKPVRQSKPEEDKGDSADGETIASGKRGLVTRQLCGHGV